MRLFVACGWCQRVRLDGWVEEGEALRRLRTYEWPEPPGFRHAVCDDCLERLVRRREVSDAEAVAA